MAAPKGNRFWEARSRHGRKPLFDSPEQLKEMCFDYFQWVEDNPLYETKAFHYQGAIIKEELPKMRAMTINGLCIFLGCTLQTWTEYRAKEDFSDVVKYVEKVIYDQKFSGAAADLLNANIIARDLGLADRKDLTSTDGSMSTSGDSVSEAIARKYASDN